MKKTVSALCGRDGEAQSRVPQQSPPMKVLKKPPSTTGGHIPTYWMLRRTLGGCEAVASSSAAPGWVHGVLTCRQGCRRLAGTCLPSTRQHWV